MYRKQKRIPTILALLIIGAGIGVTIYLDRFSQNTSTSAKTVSSPKDVHFTNINSSTFTISWMTDNPSAGWVEVSDDSGKRIFMDDLDSDNIPRPRLTHYSIVNDLKENSNYQVKIIGGDSKCTNSANCPSFSQQTGTKLTAKIDLPAIKGKILADLNKTANGAIVYLLIEHFIPLSARTDSAGLWVIPLNNLRPQDPASVVNISDNDLVQISAYLTSSQFTTGVTDIRSIRQNLPIPPMQIGNSYNFTDLLSKQNLIASLNNQSILGTQDQIKQPNSMMSILFPANDEDITVDTQPRFRGTGPKGGQLLITINSATQLGKVKVGNDGTWSWRPPYSLPPGTHYITLQGYDNAGKLITQKRKFIVLKSGERVLGNATSSATLTPTNPAASPSSTPSPIAPSPTGQTATPTITTITPTLAPSITPSPTVPVQPTVQPTSTPRTGSLQPELYLLGGSLSLLLVGAAKFIFFP